MIRVAQKVTLRTMFAVMLRSFRSWLAVVGILTFSWWHAPAFGQIVNPGGGGDVVTWTGKASANYWHQNGNWNLGVPQDGEAVIIGFSEIPILILSEYEAPKRIRSLHLSGGAELSTYGSKLPVGNSTGDATTTLIGEGTELRVSYNHQGNGPAFDTDYLNLQNGASFRLYNSGYAQVDREIDMVGDVEIGGYGLLEVLGGGNAIAFSATSKLSPVGGDLRLRTPNGSIYLGNAEIDATAWTGGVRFEGPLSSPIYNTMRVGTSYQSGENEIYFQHPWQLDGLLNFTNGRGSVTGAEGRIEGEITVDAFRTGEIHSDLNLTSSGKTTLNPFSTLKLHGEISSHANHLFDLKPGSLLQINSPAGNSLGTYTEYSGRVEADSAILELNLPAEPDSFGHWTNHGVMTLGGSTQVPSTIRGTSSVMQSGQMFVTGIGARTETGIQFRPGSSTWINPGAELEIADLSVVHATAQLGGGGRIRIEEQGQLLGLNSAVVDSDVINLGDLQIGIAVGVGAHFEVAEDYYQAGDGRLHIGMGPYKGLGYDRLLVGGRAHLGGVLEVAAWGDYEPSLGDDFLVLAANEGFSGRFEDVVLPALGEGLAWYLDYTPNDLILSVVQDVFDADTNNSGQVDGFDFLAIQRGFGGPSPNPADATGDGYVNGADIARWQEQYGTNPSSKVGLGAVPEPSSLVLLSVLGLVALTKRR